MDTDKQMDGGEGSYSARDEAESTKGMLWNSSPWPLFVFDFPQYARYILTKVFLKFCVETERMLS